MLVYGVNVFAIQGDSEFQPDDALLLELDSLMPANFGTNLSQESGLWVYNLDLSPAQFLARLGALGKQNGVTFKVEINDQEMIYYTYCGEKADQKPLSLDLRASPRTLNYIMVEGFLQTKGLTLEQIYPELRALDEKILSLLGSAPSPAAAPKAAAAKTSWQSLALSETSALESPASSESPAESPAECAKLPIFASYKPVLPQARESSPLEQEVAVVQREQREPPKREISIFRGKPVKPVEIPSAKEAGLNKPTAGTLVEAPVQTDLSQHQAPAKVVAKAPVKASPARASPSKASPGKDPLESMTVAQLKAELDAKQIKYKSKSVKAELIAMLRDSNK